jgi:hypothetical protein
VPSYHRNDVRRVTLGLDSGKTTLIKFKGSEIEIFMRLPHNAADRVDGNRKQRGSRALIGISVMRL